jgi:hypothetical protein
MKNNNKIEVILFSRYFPSDVQQRELVKWLGTTLQPAIKEQHEKTQKVFLNTLKHSEPIYLS